MGEVIRINTRTLKRIIDRIQRKCGVVPLDVFLSYEFQNSGDKHIRLFRNCVWALNKKRSLSKPNNRPHHKANIQDH